MIRVQKFFFERAHRLLLALVSRTGSSYFYWQCRWIKWTSIGPPWRMTKKEAAFYGECLKKIKRGSPRVLILGATPTLRILAHRSGARVFCADFSLPMLKHMGKYVETAVPGALKKEMWFHGNWNALPYPESFFDFVLGDNVFLFLNRTDRRNLLQAVKRTLISGGYFVTRTHVIEKNLDFKDCLRFFFEKDYPIVKGSGREVSTLNVKMLDASWDPETGKTNRQSFTLAVREFEKTVEGQKTKDLLSLFLKEYKNGIDFHFEKRSDLEQELAGFFGTKEIYEADDHGFPVDGYPIYVLQGPRNTGI